MSTPLHFKENEVVVKDEDHLQIVKKKKIWRGAKDLSVKICEYFQTTVYFKIPKRTSAQHRQQQFRNSHKKKMFKLRTRSWAHTFTRSGHSNDSDAVSASERAF